MVGRINHQVAHSLDGTHINGAESFFSRMRRTEVGYHHHIAGTYFARYAQEAGWREDHRRDPNGTQLRQVVGPALVARPSVNFCGYWQRAMGARVSSSGRSAGAAESGQQVVDVPKQNGNAIAAM